MSTDEKTATTRREIRDRLNAIAPYPDDTTPDHARAVAKYLAVSAQRRWKWNLDIADMDTAEYRQSVQAMMGDFAALHLLVHLMETAPVIAEGLSKQIRNAWDDGGGIGEWLWEHATSLGIDPAEVSRLEAAWWAASETPAAGNASAERAAGARRVAREAVTQEAGMPGGYISVPWDRLAPYEQEQGGYWLYGPHCDVYGNGKIWIRVRRPDAARKDQS